MERALMEKLENGTCDEIDKEMIASRCLSARKEIRRIFGQLDKDLRELAENYADELRVSRVGIVCGVTDCTDDDGDIQFKVGFGTPPILAKIMTCILKEVEK